MHVGVLGAGSLGSLIGGFLARELDVTLVGRPDHVQAIQRDGLTVDGEVSFDVHPTAVTSWSAVSDPDLCLVTVKSYDTEEAAAEIDEAPPPTVLTLQNGIGPLETLEETLPESTNVLGGTTTYGALLERPGVVQCTGLGEITIGTRTGVESPDADAAATSFSRAGINCLSVDDFPRRRWEKLVINAAINPITALAGVRNGAIRREPLRPIADRAAREAVTIAGHEGLTLDPNTAVENVFAVARSTEKNESSMARDLRRGRRTEIDSITGAIIQRADSHDRSVLVLETLDALVRAAERSVGDE